MVTTPHNEPRPGTPVTYCRVHNGRLWMMPAQVLEISSNYNQDPPGRFPVLRVVYYDYLGLSPLPGQTNSDGILEGLVRLLLGPSRQKPAVGWHYSDNLVHRDHWVGDDPEEFWAWPEECPQLSSIRPQGNRCGMGWQLDREEGARDRAASLAEQEERVSGS